MTNRYATADRSWQVEVVNGCLLVTHDGREAGRVPAGPPNRSLDPAGIAALARLGVPVEQLRPDDGEPEPVEADPLASLPAQVGEPVTCWACHRATLVRRGQWWYEVGTAVRHTCPV